MRPCWPGTVVILAGVLLVLFLGTRLGLSIRATGDNIDMVRASSVNPTFTITVGLCVANALTALSGASGRVSMQNTADINGGTGNRRNWSGLPDHRRDCSWARLRLW